MVMMMKVPLLLVMSLSQPSGAGGEGERDPNHCKDQDNSTTMKKEMQETQGRREGVE